MHINNSNILFPIARKVNTSYVLFVFFCLKCVERKGFSPFLSYDVQLGDPDSATIHISSHILHCVFKCVKVCLFFLG